jgi:hypothetical protein
MCRHVRIPAACLQRLRFSTSDSVNQSRVVGDRTDKWRTIPESKDVKMQMVIGEKRRVTLPAALKAIATPALTIAAVAMMATAAIKLTNKTGSFGVFCSPTFLLATIIAIVYRAVNPIGWNLVLGGLGYPTNKIDSIRIWLIAESRRWLPGGIWGYASRATRSAELGVPVGVASASMLIELMITVAAAMLLTMIGVIFHYNDLAETLQRMILEKIDIRILAAASAVGVVILSVMVFATRRKVIVRLADLIDRFKLLADVNINTAKIGSALGYMILMAMLNGLIGLALLPMVDGMASVPALAMMAATAAAWIIGFFAFFSPGGLFVREAALATLLLPWIPYETGITMAIFSRIAQMVAEASCMLPMIWQGCRGSRKM